MMRLIGLIFCIVYLGTNGFCQDIQILSDFDHGSIGSLKQVSENKFKGQTMHWIEKNKIGEQYYWFYFMVVNGGGKELTFELENMTGIYRGEHHEVYMDDTKPVISYDDKNWERISDVHYDESTHCFQFSTFVDKDTAYLAYAHPYRYSSYLIYLQNILRNKFVTVSRKGYSGEHRPLYILKITNTKSKRKKKSVLILSLQHGGEDAGGYFIEGAMDFLTSKNSFAKKVRDEFVFYIIPVLNPDGLFHGCTRYTPRMEDLNKEWDDHLDDTLSLPTEPEVAFVLEWMGEYKKSQEKLDLFVDVHCHTQQWKQNAFYCADSSLLKLGEMSKGIWPLSNSTYKKSLLGSAEWFFYEKYQIPSTMIELTQSHPGNGDYVKIDDYINWGEGFVRAIYFFYKENKL